MKLSALQQHCLAGIGITPWQLRSLSSDENNSDFSVSRVSVEQHSIQQPQNLVNQLEQALSLLEQSQSLTSPLRWRINSHSQQMTLIKNQLTLPPLALVFNSPVLKKQLWQLLTDVKS